MKTQVFTTKNFSTKVSGILRRGETYKADLQGAIMFGLNYFSDTKNPLYLSVLRQKLQGSNDLQTIEAYICAHANVHKAEDKNDSPIFKMNGKATVAEVVAPEAVWYAPKTRAPKAVSQPKPLDTILDDTFKSLAKKSPELEVAAMLLNAYAHSPAFKAALAKEFNARMDAIAASKAQATELVGTSEEAQAA